MWSLISFLYITIMMKGLNIHLLLKAMKAAYIQMDPSTTLLSSEAVMVPLLLTYLPLFGPDISFIRFRNGILYEKSEVFYFTAPCLV